jgi:hypothetical protein
MNEGKRYRGLKQTLFVSNKVNNRKEGMNVRKEGLNVRKEGMNVRNEGQTTRRGEETGKTKGR